MRRLSSFLLVATMVVSVVQIAAPEAQARRGGPTYYLALGDSVAAGFQPGKGETPGYVGMLGHIIRHDVISDLEVRNLGCPGETSRSLVTGERSPCNYAAGSQLDAALAFLDAHAGHVAFITIDIGGNDLLQTCLTRGLLIPKTCATEIGPHLANRIGHILDALGDAAGSSVPILGMTYYNPFLGLWGLVPGGRHLARADQRAWVVFNEGLATAYGDGGATVADVATTFRIDAFDETVMVPGRGELPVNVALACRWTWFCSPRFAGDVHPNRTGYAKIAHTFSRELKPLLPS